MSFLEEVIEKSLHATLLLGQAGFSEDDFTLSIATYKSVLLMVGCVCIIISLLCFIHELRKKK